MVFHIRILIKTIKFTRKSQEMREIDWNIMPIWMQAIGALITCLGLVYTLILQQNMLKEQQKINNLLFKKHIEENLPILSLKKNISTNYNGTTTLPFHISLDMNYLINLEIYYDFPNWLDLSLPEHYKNIIIQKDRILPFILQAKKESPILEKKRTEESYSIDLNFSDKFGNKYIQKIIYNGGENLYLQPAFRI